jgi:hypothetical protein
MYVLMTLSVLDVLNLLYTVVIERWTQAEFATNRQAVLQKLTQGNSYPRPNGSGNIARAWADESGWKVLSWITERVGAVAADGVGIDVQNQLGGTALSNCLSSNQTATV